MRAGGLRPSQIPLFWTSGATGPVAVAVSAPPRSTMACRSDDDSRTRIADAAIALLADVGAAGVTHEALDRVLALPSGSTQRHFDTRAALLSAAAERLALLDGRDVVKYEATAAGAAAIIEHSLAPARRQRLLARFELFLTAARCPEFESIRWVRELFLAGTEAQLRLNSVDRPELAAVGVVAMIEGLLLHSLLAGPIPADDQQRLLRRMFDGVADQAEPPAG